MQLEELVQNKRNEILAVAAKHGAYNIRIFGSVARGESKAGSDVDFLVDMEDRRSLFDLSHLWIELETLLGCKVHVAEEAGLYWFLKDQVLQEAVAL